MEEGRVAKSKENGRLNLSGGNWNLWKLNELLLIEEEIQVEELANTFQTEYKADRREPWMLIQAANTLFIVCLDKR